MVSSNKQGMLSLNAATRHQTIRHALKVNGRVSIAELKERFGVSVVTIREDLKYLERQGVLTRTRGGAMAMTRQGVEMPLEITSQALRKQKRAIGRMAASMVENGQTVIMDVGSTTTEMAKSLSPELTNVTTITNGLNIALNLESIPGVTVVVTGGTLRPLQHSLVAPLGNVLLEQLNADVAFIGCNGVHPAKGVTNANLAEAEIKRAMIRSAARTVLLADHEKVGCVSSAFVAGLDEIDLLITDSGTSEEVLADLRLAGLTIEVADTEEG